MRDVHGPWALGDARHPLTPELGLRMQREFSGVIVRTSLGLL